MPSYDTSESPRPAPVLVGESPALRLVHQEVEYAARSDAKVLVTGASGVGKEVVAHLIHARSRRRHAPMLTINCAAMPDTLLESELFGHARGSFTDAYRDKRGLFESAHGGTVFLDEVGEMSLRMQALLLRFLETGEIQRVGAERARTPVNVRVVAATNRRLLERIAAGEFREDLYYRLNVIGLLLPPLRDRRDDVPLLAQHFLRKHAERSGVDPGAEVGISQDAMRRLMGYDWPGNVRQLENVVERALVLSRGRRPIGLADFPPELQVSRDTVAPGMDLPDGGVDLPALVAGIERSLIQRALERAGGSRADAARLLSLKRTTLVEKLRRMPDLAGPQDV